MMPEDEKTLTIACRTMKNLNYIYSQKNEKEPVEEFTQLINSMLGIVISLREDYFKRSAIAWDDVEASIDSKEKEEFDNLKLKSEGDNVSEGKPELKKINTFSQLMANVRHAFSHNNFTLISGENKVITAIELWNIPQRKENKEINRTWEVTFLEEELLYFINVIFTHLEKTIGTCKELENPKK